jgi:hypothetical protein
LGCGQQQQMNRDGTVVMTLLTGLLSQCDTNLLVEAINISAQHQHNYQAQL